MSVAPAASADELATTNGGTGSNGTASSLDGVANVPTLRTVLPGASPYSDSTENNVVTFGDSFTSNSHWLVNDHPYLASQYPRQAGCLTAPDAWPALLGITTGRPVQNWACNAHTTSQMLGRIDKAIAAGHVNDTSLVVLAAGMNDKRRGVSDEQVVMNLVAGVEKVRESAPKARIVLLGRLATTDQNGVFCSTNVMPNRPTGNVDRTTAAYEAATQANQKEAAKRAGVEFIDIRDMTMVGNSTCAPDADRYVSGNRDYTTPGFNMNAHPSIAGSRFLAAQVAAILGSGTAAEIADAMEDAGLGEVPVLGDVADALEEAGDKDDEDGS
ncbi:MAG TPA: SGNH/GDSL hydrolase family protein [Candidatus Corynebacterium avicola]|uniref:SGNH/GDSL hydrolase family protein n=1 Tax=Candidatus Corynebacterium avicola TaxID=2838527 RepID=A0A9D1UMI0_9CORY|nr:SGNH/GDSL hydrolase family protein [Candidatus Corynebacterium avicola]